MPATQETHIKNPRPLEGNALGMNDVVFIDLVDTFSNLGGGEGCGYPKELVETAPRVNAVCFLPPL